MKLALIFIILAVSSCAFAQDRGNVMYQSAGPATAIAFGAFEKGSAAPIKGAPYSAEAVNETIQTLAQCAGRTFYPVRAIFAKLKNLMPKNQKTTTRGFRLPLS